MMEAIAAKFAGQLGAGLGQGLGDAIGGGGGGPTITGGQTDARSFMDGSGWTVSTGRGSATGARQDGRSTMGGPSVAQPAPLAMAGMGDNPLMLVLLLAFGYAVWKSR